MNPFFILDRARPDSQEDRLARTDFLERIDPETETIRTGDACVCLRCSDYVGMLKWLPPYEVELECWGKEFGDICFDTGELIVSERFKRLYEEWSLTGLTNFDPVKILSIVRRRRIKGDPPPYFYVQVNRTRAAIDQLASGFVWKVPPTCDECRLGRDLERFERIIIEPQTWTGEDIYIPRGLSCFVTSPKFRQFYETNKITGARLVPADQYWYDSYGWKKTKEGLEIMSRPVGSSLYEKIKPDGDIVRYDAHSNHLVIGRINEKNELRIVGFFEPRDGLAAWERI